MLDLPPVGCFDIDETVAGLPMLFSFQKVFAEEEPIAIARPDRGVLGRTVRKGRTLTYFGHAKADLVAFENSCLVAADGPLSFADILADAELGRMKLALLGGCQTGLNPNVGAIHDEYYGLDGAIIAKGCESVISSLWPVAEDSGFLLSWKVLHLVASGQQEAASMLSTAVSWLRSGEWQVELDKILTCGELERCVSRARMTERYKAWAMKSGRMFLEHLRALPSSRFSHPVHWAAWRCSGLGGDLLPDCQPGVE